MRGRHVVIGQIMKDDIIRWWSRKFTIRGLIGVWFLPLLVVVGCVLWFVEWAIE